MMEQHSHLTVLPAEGEPERVGFLPQFCITDTAFGCSAKVYRTVDDSADVIDFFVQCDLPGILIDEGHIKTHIPGRKGWKKILTRRRIGEQMSYFYPDGERAPDRVGTMIAWFETVHHHFSQVSQGFSSEAHHIKHQGDISTFDNGRVRMVWN